MRESRISATVARLLMISALFSLKALACTYAPPSYKVGNDFIVEVSSLEGTTFAGVRVILLHDKTAAGQAVTNEEGKARFENVKAGDYLLEVDQLGTAGWDTAMLKVVDGSKAKNIELRWPSSRILRATRIKGALLDSQTAEPLAGTSLQLVTALSGSLSAKLLTDESGRFDLGSPEPGLYFIKVQRSGDRELLGSIAVLVVPSGARELPLVLEESSCGMMYSEVCTASPATLGQLQGSLSDEEGAVIDRAQVQLVAKSTNQAETRNTVPDQKGHFLIKDVEPGDYQLKITAAYFAHLVIPVTVAPNARSDNSLDVRLTALGGACSTAKVHQPKDKAN